MKKILISILILIVLIAIPIVLSIPMNAPMCKIEGEIISMSTIPAEYITPSGKPCDEFGLEIPERFNIEINLTKLETIEDIGLPPPCTIFYDLNEINNIIVSKQDLKNINLEEGQYISALIIAFGDECSSGHRIRDIKILEEPELNIFQKLINWFIGIFK